MLLLSGPHRFLVFFGFENSIKLASRPMEEYSSTRSQKRYYHSQKQNEHQVFIKSKPPSLAKPTTRRCLLLTQPRNVLHLLQPRSCASQAAPGRYSRPRSHGVQVGIIWFDSGIQHVCGAYSDTFFITRHKGSHGYSRLCLSWKLLLPSFFPGF
jgi:hypothetical protein